MDSRFRGNESQAALALVDGLLRHHCAAALQFLAEASQIGWAGFMSRAQSMLLMSFVVKPLDVGLIATVNDSWGIKFADADAAAVARSGIQLREVIGRQPRSAICTRQKRHVTTARASSRRNT
jgi:hypothetical protein